MQTVQWSTDPLRPGTPVRTIDSTARPGAVHREVHLSTRNGTSVIAPVAGRDVVAVDGPLTVDATV